jgi:hypothetical protein
MALQFTGRVCAYEPQNVVIQERCCPAWSAPRELERVSVTI